MTEKTIDMLNALPLTEVMRNNGYPVAAQTAKEAFYLCPFHAETNGSFCVSKFPPKGERYAAFNCFVCGKESGSRGVGAILLQQKLLDDHAYFFISHLNMGIVTKANVTGIRAYPCDYYEITADLAVE